MGQTSIAASKGGLLAPAATWGGFGSEDNPPLASARRVTLFVCSPLLSLQCYGNKCSARVAYQRQHRPSSRPLLTNSLCRRGDTLGGVPALFTKRRGYHSFRRNPLKWSDLKCAQFWVTMIVFEERRTHTMARPPLPPYGSSIKISPLSVSSTFYLTAVLSNESLSLPRPSGRKS